MDNTENVLYSILIGIFVANFLLNTGRGLKAIELSKECLIFLNNEAVQRGQPYFRKIKKVIYVTMFLAYRLIRDDTNAIKYGRKLLLIYRERSETAKEGELTIALAEIYERQCKHAEAKMFYERAISIMIETRDRQGEADAYAKFGTMFCHLNEHVKTQEYLRKALAIRMEIGDRQGEASALTRLGIVFQRLGEYGKAKECHEKALAIRIEIGDRKGEAVDYGNLGSVFKSLGEYVKAKEYLEKALAIKIEIGDKEGEATDYGNLGTVFLSLGEYVKAKEYLEKALAIRIEIGDREGEAADYGNLATVFESFGEYAKATEYLEKSLSITQDIDDGEKEFQCLCKLTLVKLLEGKIQEAVNYFLLSIKKSEDLRNFLQDNDQFKISFSDVHVFPYQHLSALLCSAGNPNDALYVEELGRARALADLMADQYSLENKQISPNPQSWIGIENIMRKERNCACLYITYCGQDVHLWILKTSGVIYFRRITVNEDIVCAGLVPSLDEFFAKSFRSFGILPEKDCEDRSLNNVEPELKSSQNDSDATLRLVEEDDEEGQHWQHSESCFSLCYRMLISPVSDLLGNEEPEIIVVPHRFLYKVPFAALHDENGKYLSETFRLRIVPSLTTLKLIQDSPVDYHSETGALIVGDPKVGWAFYRGRVENFKPLECARAEAKMVAQLMGVQPLLGEQATKQAVLDMVHSVSLVHFAAHGNAERGEIALAPTARTATQVPHEKDYLLTMSDISRVRLRAKLVVLSCCHSGRGHIRAEGVVGIARAFLGSGARSVLVALWALGDRATEQLMRRFYEHLAAGESASESLHEAMKWMRGNGFAKVDDWAPFMLIGDNVTLQFGK